MSISAFIIFIVIGLAGLIFGIYLIFSIVMQKKWIEGVLEKRKHGSPIPVWRHFIFPPILQWNSPFINRMNLITIGIGLIVFCGGLIFGVVQEYIKK